MGSSPEKTENPVVRADLSLPRLGSNLALQPTATVGLIKVKRLKYSAPFRTSRLDYKSRDAIYVGLETIAPGRGNPFRDA